MSVVRSLDAKNGLGLHRAIAIATGLSVFAYIFICHYFAQQIQLAVDESQRLLIRSILYVIAIATFPITNLLRFVLLRLNQTIPGDSTPRQRYLLTIVVTQAMMETVALFGVLMFVLGDDFNTLYIFGSMAVLGCYLHRPKPGEYRAIVESFLSRRQ